MYIFRHWLATLLAILINCNLIDGIQYSTIDLTGIGDNSECALVLNGPGRSSSFDYTYNLLRGSPAYVFALIFNYLKFN